jgi:hypothetical protein
MRQLLLAAALACLAAPAARATDCRVNIVIDNAATNPEVFVTIESRTRANPRFVSASIAFAQPLRSLLRASGRSYILAPGETARGVLTFPIVGCNVARQVRYTYWCNFTDGRGAQERVFNLNGGNFWRPTDVTFAPTCS